MSGQIFDIVNLVIAVGALLLAALTAYWQHRKVDRLKIAFLNQHVRQGSAKGTTYVYLTFSIANTGSMPEIISSAHYVVPHPDVQGQTLFRGHDPSGGRFGPHLITAGNLMQVDVRFELHDAEMPRGQLKDRPAKLHLEIVDGRGDLVARQIDGFGVAKLDSGGWHSVAPLGQTAILLPKPAVDRSTPFTI